MLKVSKKISRLRTETAFDVLKRAEMLSQEGRGIINLGIGQPNFETPKHIVEAAVAALYDGHHGYTSAPDISILRELVAEDLFEFTGVSVKPERIVIVPGGKVTIFFLILMFGEHGVEILYPNPGFSIYQSMIEFTGAKAIPIKLREEDNFSFTADVVLAQITENTRLLILNSPGNPTGGTIPKNEIDRLVLGLAEKFPWVAVLSEEIYSRITYGGQDLVSLLIYPELADRLILLDGWSKRYAMTGWRIGYGVWPESLVENAIRLSINCHSCVNTASQYAGITALNGPQDSVVEMVSQFSKRRRLIVQGLNDLSGVSCIMPSGAFYAFPNIKETGLRADIFQDLLLESAGVATVGGTSFGLMGEGYLRFFYANSMEHIQIALDRVSFLLETI